MKAELYAGAGNGLAGAIMDKFSLTGAQKTKLRGLGQRLEPVVMVGKGGLSSAFYAELGRQLEANELIKVRLVGADRGQRAEWVGKIVEEGGCVLVGVVGATALFYRQQADEARRQVEL